jgi:hypothetical protein
MKSINEIKIDWSTKDKLYLVSAVLMNGDQDWSFISQQLSQIYDYECKHEDKIIDKFTLSVSVF